MLINHLKLLNNLFLKDLQHPQLAMSKGSSMGGGGGGSSSSSGVGSLNSNSSHSSTSSSSSATSANNHHHGNIITNTFNDFLKSTFNFSSTSPGSNSNKSSNSINSTSSPQTAPILSTNSKISKPSIQTAPIVSTSSSVSPSSVSSTSTITNSNPYFSATTPVANASSPSDQIELLNADLSQQLSLDNSKSNNSGIPNSARVISSYSAITEDEITVQKGDIVQIITANMHNRFLVHREANEHQPAAEGWIPGFVIGFQSTNLS